MAKVKFNVKGVESGGGDRPLPKPGVYRCKVTTCVVGQPAGKDKRLEVVYTITDGDHKNFPIYDYINLESKAAAWKLRQFLEAVGVVTEKKESGEFDSESIIGTGLSVKTKIQPETDNFAASVKATLLMPLDGDADDSDDEDLNDDDDVDYSAMDLDELKEAAEEAELDVDEIIEGKKSKKAKEAALREALEENAEDGDDDDDDADDADDSDDEDEDEDDETYTEEELNDLDDDDLVDVAFGYEDEDGDEIEGILDEDEKSEYVKTKGKGKAKKVTVDRDALIARCLEAQEGDEDDETPDYASMDLKALKKLAKERELSDKGSAKVLIARLQKDDQPF